MLMKTNLTLVLQNTKVLENCFNINQNAVKDVMLRSFAVGLHYACEPIRLHKTS